MYWPRGIAVWLGVVGACLPAGAFDHSAFEGVLKKYVGNGRVDYAGLKADKDFPKYLETLAAADANSLGNTNEQIAFWINAYNASCLNGVVKRYPLSSVQKVKNFFKVKEHKVAGATRSLGDMENGVLRAKYKDPRIHFALNCASFSCPVLSSSAYTGAKLDSQLDAAAKRFLNDASRNKFSTSTRRAQLSAIFKWYSKDFGGERKMLATIAKYATPAVASMLKSGNVKVSYLDYNWTLNNK